MLNYIGANQTVVGYNNFSDIASFSRSVLDGESKSIICDRYLSSFSLDDVEKVLSLLLKKLRIKGLLTISDIDFTFLAKQIFVEESDLKLLNKHIFDKHGVIKGFLTLELIESLIPEGFVVKEKEFSSTEFKLTIQRV